MEAQIVPAEEEQRAESIPGPVDPSEPAIGRWYWWTDDKKTRRLCCVIAIGSNYVKLEGIEDYSVRVHFDDFDRVCEFEANAEAVLQERVAHHQGNVRSLMAEVRELTARLSISLQPSLSAHVDAQAIALHSAQPMKDYKTALVRAEKEDLPTIFEKIRKENETISKWMTASLIPMKAAVGALTPAMEAIRDRIFSVELYAGLSENVERVREGAPASRDEKIHLLQRRCYMDEECLARYETGGMSFKDIRFFDAWLSKKDNLERLLPFPRSVVAFQVRRHDKEREIESIADILQLSHELAADKQTFLYMRNGEQLYRLSTAIDFGPSLFPDETVNVLGETLYANVSGSYVRNIITEGDYLERRKKYIAARRQNRKAKGDESKEMDIFVMRDLQDWARYRRFDKSNVYYDDILSKIQSDMKEHNRLVLVLQGILDRSPVMAPHPPWSLFDRNGFQAALTLVYDQSRALSTGTPPDFEAYRARLNASLAVGSITVGQEDLWLQHEGDKEAARERRAMRGRATFSRARFRPYGNPGPGLVAVVGEFQKKAGKCTFSWDRAKAGGFHDDKKEIRTTFTCDASKIFNVSAYTPGDFHLFFDDPRTRADYLEWAPLLIEAEEYHAGNRKVETPAAPKPKGPSSYDNRRKYARAKMKKKLMGAAVRLSRKISTTGGETYESRSLWRVVSATKATFGLVGITPDGAYEGDDVNKRRRIHGVSPDDFVVDPFVPATPKRG